MRKTVKGTLGAAFLAAILFLLEVHVGSCTSGGSTDSSGTRAGGPKYRITTKSVIYAGSQVTLEWGSPKSVVQGVVPVDIPENTEILISFGPKMDSVKP